MFYEDGLPRLFVPRWLPDFVTDEHRQMYHDLLEPGLSDQRVLRSRDNLHMICIDLVIRVYTPYKKKEPYGSVRVRNENGSLKAVQGMGRMRGDYPFFFPDEKVDARIKRHPQFNDVYALCRHLESKLLYNKWLETLRRTEESGAILDAAAEELKQQHKD